MTAVRGPLPSHTLGGEEPKNTVPQDRRTSEKFKLTAECRGPCSVCFVALHPPRLGRLLPLLVLLVLVFFPASLTAQTPGIFRTIIGKLVPLEVIDKVVPR